MGALVALVLQLLFIAAVLYGAYWAVRIGVRHAIADSGMVGLLRSAVEPAEPEEEEYEETDEDGADSEDVEEGERR